MKKALYSLFIFTCIVIGATFLGSLLFMLYGNLMSFVANQEESFFSFKMLIPGVIVSFPIACILALFFLILLEIRREEASGFTLGLYIFMGFAVWCAFIPFDLHHSISYIQETASEIRDSEFLTDGLFRKNPDGTVEFYSRVSPAGFADGILIDINGAHGEKGAVIPFTGKNVIVETEDVFADSIIREGANISPVVAVPLGIYAELMINGTNCWMKGVWSWMAFASFGFALLSLYGLKKISSWKLLNAFLIVLCGGCVAMLNYLYWCGEVFNGIAVEWARFFSALPVSDPFILCLNLVLVIVFSAAGVIRHLNDKKKKMGVLN